MSDTDIYKNREPMPAAKKPSKKRRRRRSAPQRAFDDKERKRRSRNSGLRRLLHLFRKSENEKVIWSVVGVLFVVILVSAAVWQFVIRERMIIQNEQSDDYMRYQRDIPASSSVPLISSPVPAEAEPEESAAE